METALVAVLIGIGSIVGALVYWFGAIFTRGVKLWPRQRDNRGWVKPNPLHKIEALFWPIAWPTTWVIRLGFSGLRNLGKALSFLAEEIYHLGSQAGRDPLPPQGSH